MSAATAPIHYRDNYFTKEVSLSQHDEISSMDTLNSTLDYLNGLAANPADSKGKSSLQSTNPLKPSNSFSRPPSKPHRCNSGGLDDLVGSNSAKENGKPASTRDNFRLPVDNPPAVVSDSDESTNEERWCDLNDEKPKSRSRRIKRFVRSLNDDSDMSEASTIESLGKEAVRQKGKRQQRKVADKPVEKPAETPAADEDDDLVDTDQDLPMLTESVRATRRKDAIDQRRSRSREKRTGKKKERKSSGSPKGGKRSSSNSGRAKGSCSAGSPESSPGKSPSGRRGGKKEQFMPSSPVSGRKAGKKSAILKSAGYDEFPQRSKRREEYARSNSYNKPRSARRLGGGDEPQERSNSLERTPSDSRRVIARKKFDKSSSGFDRLVDNTKNTDSMLSCPKRPSRSSAAPEPASPEPLQILKVTLTSRKKNRRLDTETPVKSCLKSAGRPKSERHLNSRFDDDDDGHDHLLRAPSSLRHMSDHN